MYFAVLIVHESALFEFEKVLKVKATRTLKKEANIFRLFYSAAKNSKSKKADRIVPAAGMIGVIHTEKNASNQICFDAFPRPALTVDKKVSAEIHSGYMK